MGLWAVAVVEVVRYVAGVFRRFGVLYGTVVLYRSMMKIDNTGTSTTVLGLPRAFDR